MAKRSVDSGKQRTSATLSDDDTALISEALRIAAFEIRTTVGTLAQVWPTSPLVERLNVCAEQMTDLRQRIDA